MKDHYVSQTYLDAFTDQDGHLYPYYKGKQVILGKPKPVSAVCFEIDGDANKYFEDPRILDAYLPQFEQPWKRNVQALREASLEPMAKYQVAGYLAFLRVCTPTAKRLGQNKIRAVVQPTAQEVVEESLRLNPPNDPETRRIIEKVVRERKLVVQIDREFPHALGIGVLHDLTSGLFHGNWLVMFNRSPRPFVTSDNPAVPYHHQPDHTIAQIYVPIAPDIALLIAADASWQAQSIPSTDRRQSADDRFAVPKAEYVERFNDLIIRAAEERVLHGAPDPELESRVKENSDWRMEVVVDHIPDGQGTVTVTRELPQRRGLTSR